MKIKVLIGMVIICMIGTITVQGQQKDVKGWREAKWGMTEDEIIKAFKGEAIHLEKIEDWPDFYASVGINDFMIEGEPYKVRFLMSKSKKVLQQVSIFAEGGFFNLRYKKLEQLLTEKYGAPSFKNVSVDKSTVAWNFPFTIIELIYMNLNPIKFENLSLIFRPPKEIWKNLHYRPDAWSDRKDAPNDGTGETCLVMKDADPSGKFSWPKRGRNEN